MDALGGVEGRDGGMGECVDVCMCEVSSGSDSGRNSGGWIGGGCTATCSCVVVSCCAGGDMSSSVCVGRAGGGV